MTFCPDWLKFFGHFKKFSLRSETISFASSCEPQQRFVAASQLRQFRVLYIGTVLMPGLFHAFISGASELFSFVCRKPLEFIRVMASRALVDFRSCSFFCLADRTAVNFWQPSVFCCFVPWPFSVIAIRVKCRQRVWVWPAWRNKIAHHVSRHNFLIPDVLKSKPEAIAHAPKAGLGNLRPASTFDMARIRIFVTQFRVQDRVKTKFHDRQVLR